MHGDWGRRAIRGADKLSETMSKDMAYSNSTPHFLKAVKKFQALAMPGSGTERGRSPTMYGGEEATPFPAMPDNHPGKSDSRPPSR